ncbi:MAG TPA: hypothetical protein VIY86_08230 [Pirellulaceae bacterium]
MKGPFGRLRWELRRVWECPACHHRERTGGDRTACWCNCATTSASKGTAMRLIEDGPRRRVLNAAPLPLPPPPDVSAT